MNFNINQLILSSLIFCPLVGALIVMLLPQKVAREGAIAVTILNFIFSLHLWFNWATSTPDGGYRFVQKMAWAPQFGLSYHLGVDGISAGLVILTAFITPIALFFGWNEIQSRVKSFVVCVLLLESVAIGVFCALDVILFYVFFEAVLIPSYLLIAGWGGANRAAAAIKLFCYTMAGSVFLWIAALYLYFQQDVATRSFDLAAMTAAANNVDASTQSIALWLFAAVAVAFAIKTPLFPFHTWQPEAYKESPTSATILLAAILSKMGTYGFIRFAIPFFPSAAHDAAPIMIVLALVSIVYGALVAMRQTDIKRLFAYSSLSHLGFVILGIFASLLASKHADIALSGATLQMIAHGITTAALFGIAGMLYQRRSTLALDQFGGLAAVMPRFTSLFWIALFASIGLPGLCNFAGEFLILQGTMDANFWYAAIAATTVIWGAIYMLNMFREVMFGETKFEENRTLPDAGKRETFALALLILVMIWIGVAPQSLLDKINPDAQKISTLARGESTQNVNLAQR
jgi:NADH-quinone oxidoreductase subunit M